MLYEGIKQQFYCIIVVIIYSKIGLLSCKYEPFWQEVKVEVTVKASGSRGRYYLPLKRMWSFIIWTNLIPFTQEYFVPSYDEIGIVVLKKNI